MPQGAETGQERKAAGRQRGFVLLVVLRARAARDCSGKLRADRTLARESGAGRRRALARKRLPMPEFSSSSSTSSAPARPSHPAGALPWMRRRCSAASAATAPAAIAVQDEAGKVDLNMGSEPLLRLGVRSRHRRRGRQGRCHSRFQGRGRRPACRRRRAPPDTGLPADRSVPATVLSRRSRSSRACSGVAQADADRLRPFVTIYSGLPAIDANVAPEALIDIVARGSDQAGGSRPFGGIAMGMGRKGPARRCRPNSLPRRPGGHSRCTRRRARRQEQGSCARRWWSSWRRRLAPTWFAGGTVAAPCLGHRPSPRAFRPASARGAPPERRPATACGTPWPLPPGCAPAASA